MEKSRLSCNAVIALKMNGMGKTSPTQRNHNKVAALGRKKLGERLILIVNSVAVYESWPLVASSNARPESLPSARLEVVSLRSPKDLSLASAL